MNRQSVRRAVGALITLMITLLAWRSIPAQSQVPSTLKIESDDTQVVREGQWISQPASAGSGGGYLYNNPAEAESAQEAVLQLSFAGPTIEVMYVSGPSLGTLALEVDGTVLRTIITTADQTSYGQSTKIDYLTDESHILRVYAQAGDVVGVDAFIIPVPNSPPLNDGGNSTGVTRDVLGSGGWMATYFRRFPTSTSCTIPALTDSPPPSGATMYGPYPVAEINFDWGSTDGPSYVAPTTDTFGIIFRRTVIFAEATTMTINYWADDGIRMYDNGVQFTNRWGCYSATPYSITHTFTAGSHNLEIHYVEISGSARIAVTFSTSLLAATPIATSQVHLAWSDPFISETNYRVERSPIGTPNWVEIATLPADSANYDDTGLVCGTYTYRVRAYFSGTATYSPYSNVATVTTGPCLANPPTNLTATALSDDQIQLTWVDNATDETEYRLERSADGVNNWVEIAVLPADSTTYINTTLLCSTPYFYRVWAYRAVDMNYSTYSNVANATTAACPANCDPNAPIGLVSVATDGMQGTGFDPLNITYAYPQSISDNGRFVAFMWRANNIVAGDNNNAPDIFLRDRLTCQTHLISFSLTHTIGNSFSDRPSISGDGRYIAFSSSASNLVANDTNNTYDVFLHDRELGLTTRISVNSNGEQATGATYGSFSPRISADGRYVVYDSDASNLVAGDTNTASDIFVYDRQMRQTTRVSVSSSGAQAVGGTGGLSVTPDISADGRYVVFYSYANNLVPNDTNNSDDVFVRDLQTNTTSLVSVSSAGIQGNSYSDFPTISDDGRYVAFTSYASNLVDGDTNAAGDVFVRDLQTNTTIRVSVTNTGAQTTSPHSSDTAQISGNGRYVLFETYDSLVPTDPGLDIDVYVRDLQLGVTRRVSVTESGAEPNNYAMSGSIDQTGRFVIFSTSATNVLASDTNGATDIFVVDLQNPTVGHGLSVGALDSSQIGLYWMDDAADETEYRVERSPDGVNNWTEIGVAPANAVTYTDNGLSCETSYSYRIRAYRASDMTYMAYSNVASATTTFCPLVAPGEVTATALSAGQVQINWTDTNTSETGYELLRSMDGVNNWTIVWSTFPNQAITTYSVSGLSCETTYYYSVRAKRAYDHTYSPLSNVATVTMPPCLLAAPTNLTAMTLSNSQIELTWTDTNLNETNYRIELSSDGVNGWYEIGSVLANTTTYTSINLICNDTYYYRVRAYNSVEASYSAYASVASATTSLCALAVPTSVAGVAQSASQIQVTWTDTNSDETNYRVERSPSGTSNWVEISTVTANTTTYTDGGLSCGTYYYRVRAYRAADTSYSAYSGVANATPLVCPLTAPTNLTWTALSTSQIRLTWTDTNTSESNYRVERSSDGINNWVEIGTAAVNGTTYTNTGLTCHTSYQYRVRAYRALDTSYSDYSTIVVATTSLCPLAAPTNLLTHLVTGTQISMNWVDNATDESEYRVERQANGSNQWVEVAVLAANSTTFTDTDNAMLCEMTYYYRVRAYRAADGAFSAYSNGAGTGTTRCPIFAPTNLTATVISGTQINLTWMDNSTNEADFRLVRDGNQTTPELVAVIPANTTSYSDMGLTCGTSYRYHIRAYRVVDFGASDPSNYVTVSTALCSVVAPTNLDTLTNTRQILLHWIDNSLDESTYRVERSSDGTLWTQIAEVPAYLRYYIDVGLDCGTPYQYRVRAYRAVDGAFSAYSNVLTATTAVCLPDALAVFNPTTHSANLIRTLANPPVSNDYSSYATGFPRGAGGQYVMGDWNGDGMETMGVYLSGAFWYTNDYGQTGNWTGMWFGLGGQAIAGRFNASIGHDCIGVTDSGTWTTGDTFFALYFTCNLTSGPTPTLTYQWLSIILPTSTGHSGTFQFSAGDFDGDGVDSIAIRRGNYVAWTNVPPATLLSEFSLAQYFGAPGTGDEGKFVVGDWDLNNVDSFGLVYQNGRFYRRDDLQWNSGAYTVQQFTPLVGTPFSVTTWQPS